MYKNLIDSMKTFKISQQQISDLLEIRQATVSDKLNGVNKGFYFDEAIKIKKVFFPNLDIEYLFEKEN